MKKWRLVAGVTLVFFLGVLGGVVGTQLCHRYHIDRLKKDPAARRAYILKRLTKELRLTDNQQEEFRLIIGEVDEKRRAFLTRTHAEMQVLLDEGFARMKEKLEPQQHQRLGELKARVEKDLKEGRKKPPLR